jgi:hypothetical protein
MPFQLIDAKELSYIRLLGTVTRKDLTELAKEWALKGGQTPESPNRIIDLVGVNSFEVNPEALTALAVQRRESSDKAIVKAVIISSENLDFEMSGFSQTNAEGRQIEVRILSSFDAAISWMGQERADQSGWALIPDLRPAAGDLHVS